MSNTTHTPGKLHIGKRSTSFAAYGELGEEVACVGATLAAEEEKENMTHIVACWNGCDGIPDPENTVPELVRTADGLLKALRQSRFKMDVKKDFSLMVHENELSKLIHKIKDKAKRELEEQRSANPEQL